MLANQCGNIFVADAVCGLRYCNGANVQLYLTSPVIHTLHLPPVVRTASVRTIGLVWMTLLFLFTPVAWPGVAWSGLCGWKKLEVTQSINQLYYVLGDKQLQFVCIKFTEPASPG